MKPHKLSLPTMLAYGFGQLSEAVKGQGFNVFLLFYYNQVLHVSATATSIVLAIALVVDAVTDPIAGGLSDKLKSRWGRRHPFILFAAVPLAITFYLLFNPPTGLSQTAYIFWLLTFAILARASMTAYYVPHLALGAELARDYHQRSTLYSFNVLFGAAGPAIFVPLSYMFFFPTTEEFNPALLNRAAYGPWALFAGALMIIAILVCVFGTAGEIPRLKQESLKRVVSKFEFRRLIVEVGEAFQNRSFRAIFFGMILSIFIISVENVFVPFMGFHFWGMTTEQLKYLPIGTITGLLLSMAVIPIATRKFDKKPTLIVSATLVIININTPIILSLTGVSWFPASGSDALLYILILNSFLTMLLAPVIFATLNSMFADITDEHELDVGERREGVIFSARTFANKASASMGLIMGGLLLDFIQFPTGARMGEVDADVLWKLGFIVGPATSVFSLIGLCLYFGYKIDRARRNQIMRELSERTDTDS